MKICPNCDKENNEESNFCVNCGFNLSKIKNKPANSDIFKPKGNLSDFQDDLSTMQRFTDETNKFINNLQLSVSTDGNVESNINQEIINIQKELDSRKLQLNDQLKVLNSNLISIDLKRAPDQINQFDFVISVDEDALNRYVEFYKMNQNQDIVYPNSFDCPVCHSELIEDIRKVNLGLRTKSFLDCIGCGLTFEKKNNGFKFVDIQDKNNNLWTRYNNYTLTSDEWIRIGHGGLSNEEQMEKDVNLFLTELQNGQSNIIFEGDSPVILKKNEVMSLILNNISLYEARAVRKTVGTYRGSSVRVAKGVSFRVGGGSAKSESHDELRKIDTGSLVLTNKRLVFLGSKRTTNIDLKKIISIEPYKDGIVSQRENKQKSEHFAGTDNNSINVSVQNRQHTIPVNGAVLKAAIIGKINQL